MNRAVRRWPLTAAAVLTVLPVTVALVMTARGRAATGRAAAKPTIVWSMVLGRTPRVGRA